MRRTNSIKNFIYGVLSQVILIAFGLVVPRLTIVSYGSEVNGLLSSVAKIFTYMTLLEAGVGAATSQALYAPVAQDDKKSMSSILAATSRYYKRTGILYGILVLVLAFAYPLAVPTYIPPRTIFLIILLQGASGVLNYFFLTKFTCLMEVEGKGYILTNLNTAVSVLTDIAKIVLIILGYNVLAVMVAAFAVGLLQKACIALYAKKHYMWIDEKASPDFNALSQKNSVLIHSASNLIMNSTDTVILTLFCGLKEVSVYAMYALIFSYVKKIIDVVFGSVNFAFGQIFHLDKDRFKKMYSAWEDFYFAISFSLLTLTYIFILPFMELYTAGVNDIQYVDKWLPLFFLAISVLNYGRKTSGKIIDFAGHFRQTRWRSIIESAINVTVSVVGVIYFGIYGVLFGTVVALLYRTNDMIIYANKTVMNMSPMKTYWRWIKNIVIMVGVILITELIPMNIDSYMSFLGYAVLICIPVVGVFMVAAFAFDKNSRSTVKSLLLNFLRRRK